MLGKGVYLAGSFDKARNFALAAQGRGHGGGGTPCVLTCEVRVKSPKYISSTDTSGKWRSEGHDAVRADGTTMSRRSEWCIADPAAISVITLKEVQLVQCGACLGKSTTLLTLLASRFAFVQSGQQ